MKYELRTNMYIMTCVKCEYYILPSSNECLLLIKL